MTEFCRYSQRCLQEYLGRCKYAGKGKKEYYPNEKLHDIYLEKFEAYKRIYPAVKSIF